MGQAIAVRTDFTAGEVRQFAKRAKDAAQARRLLAIAAVLDGALREDAAKIGGMDRQTLRDWVIRFNEQGPDGLVNIPSPGVPPKLGKKPRAFLARLVTCLGAAVFGTDSCHYLLMADWMRDRAA